MSFTCSSCPAFQSKGLYLIQEQFPLLSDGSPDFEAMDDFFDKYVGDCARKWDDVRKKEVHKVQNFLPWFYHNLTTIIKHRLLRVIFKNFN